MAQSVLEIDTKGTCLFCLNQNCAPSDRNNMDLTTATALKMLFRYLQIDLKKLPNSSYGTLLIDGSTSSSTNLAVSLCDACFFLVDEFHELFQDFERIRLQLEGCTWKLHEFIGKGTADGERVREYRRRVQSNSGDARFVEKLRMETSEKCSRKRCSVPKMRLRSDDINILMNGPEQGPRFIKIDEGTNTEPERYPVKMEVEDLQLTPTADCAAETTCESTVFTTSSISMRPVNWRTKRKMNQTWYGNIKGQARARSYTTRHKCVYCSNYVSHMSSLNAHQLMMHPVKMLSKSNRLPSDVSNEEVKCAVDRILDSEQLVRSSDGKLRCPLCHALFTDHIRKLKLHVLRCHKDPVCQSIQTQRRKQVMTPTTTGSAPVEIEFAEIIQQKDNQQITTQQTSSAQLRKDVITCDICGQGFLYKKNMYRHKRKLHKPSSFKCNLCGETCFQHEALQRHLQLIHFIKPSDNSNLSCDYCDNVFPSMFGLQHHLHVKHAMQLYSSRIPSHISKSVFESTVAAIIEKILAPVEAGNRAFQESPCVFCGKALRCASNTFLRVHLVRYHLEKVVESAEEAIVSTGHASGSSDNTTTSSFVHCKSEYPSVASIQFDDDEDVRRR